jgi:hypothetical protein
MADAWLDIDTYSLPPISQQNLSFSALSAADLQRTATRLFHDAPIASIALGDSDQLKAALEPHMKIELLGAMGTKNEAAPKPVPKPTPSSNATKPD